MGKYVLSPNFYYLPSIEFSPFCEFNPELPSSQMPVTILVVDDEPDLESLITQKFRKQIREKQYEFLFAQNGVEALGRLEEYPAVSMILSDINMPEMDGLTLLNKVNELNNPALKTVI